MRVGRTDHRVGAICIEGNIAQGRAAIRPVAAAAANAIFDTTGVRLPRVPFAPGRVRVSLA